MIITLNSYWLHAVATCLFLAGFFWAVAQRCDFDMDGPVRVLVVVVGYCLYWVAYLALTR